MKNEALSRIVKQTHVHVTAYTGRIFKQELKLKLPWSCLVPVSLFPPVGGAPLSDNLVTSLFQVAHRLFEPTSDTAKRKNSYS